MPPKSKSADLDSMLPPVGRQRLSETQTLPPVGSVKDTRKTVKPPANKTNKVMYTPHEMPLTEVQWYSIVHAFEHGKGAKLKFDKSSDDTRKVTLPLTDKQYDNFLAGRSITLSFRQLAYMKRGGFIATLAGLLAESPVLAGLAAELARPVIREVGNLGAKAIDKLGDAVGLGVGRTPKRRVKK